MLRSVAIIAWAIALSQPSMPKSQRIAYAKVMQATARAHHFDPFTGVALIHHESRWRANAVSPDGEDYGLGQIRLRYEIGCRGVPLDSPSCKAKKAQLLNGSYNIRRMGSAITAWRKTCRRLTNKPALFPRWLHGYGGMGNLKRSIICGQKKVRGRWRDLPVRKQLKEIINYRKKLIRLSKQRRRRRRG